MQAKPLSFISISPAAKAAQYTGLHSSPLTMCFCSCSIEYRLPAYTLAEHAALSDNPLRPSLRIKPQIYTPPTSSSSRAPPLQSPSPGLLPSPVPPPRHVEHSSASGSVHLCPLLPKASPRQVCRDGSSPPSCLSSPITSPRNLSPSLLGLSQRLSQRIARLLLHGTGSLCSLSVGLVAVRPAHMKGQLHPGRALLWPSPLPR